MCIQKRLHGRKSRGGLLALLLTGWVIMLTLSQPAWAVCNQHPGDFLVGEDEYNYYCESSATDDDAKKLVSDLQDLINSAVNPPSQEFLGARWQLRKSIIDTAGCVAKNHTYYGQERPVWDIIYSCRNPDRKRIDCSNLVQFSDRVGACGVDAFYKAKTDSLRSLGDAGDAVGQSRIFKKNHAWIAPGDTPFPGDTVFFGKTYPDCKKEICHAAVYLGKRDDGTMLVIQATSSKGVKIGPLSPKMQSLVVGFGNVGELYDSLRR